MINCPNGLGFGVLCYETPACHQFSSVQSLRLFATPWTEAHQVSLSITDSRSLLKLMSIELVMTSNLLCYPLLPSIFPSIRVFPKESVLLIRWPKYWSISFSINPSNEYSELIPLGLTGLISLQSKDSQESPPTPQFKIDLKILHFCSYRL